MSGASGPISIPLPTAGFAVFSGEHVWKLTPGIGWRYGLHMGNNSGFSIS